MPKQLLVKGHTLPNEGKLPGFYLYQDGVGRVRCSCDKRSPELPSTSARQRWHRQHKLNVLAAQERACDEYIAKVEASASQHVILTLFCAKHGEARRVTVGGLPAYVKQQDEYPLFDPIAFDVTLANWPDGAIVRVVKEIRSFGERRSLSVAVDIAHSVKSGTPELILRTPDEDEARRAFDAFVAVGAKATLEPVYV